MSREQNIPLILWISTAILAHIATVGGAEQTAHLLEDRADLHSFARAIHDRMHPEVPLEVVLEPAAPALTPPAATVAPQPESKPKAQHEEIKPPEPEAPPPPKQERKPVLVPQAGASAQPPKPPPEPQADRRIAVRQHADPNQEDNPNAQFVGDEANHVAEESVARITSHDQDDPNPTPGGHHTGPEKEAGNSDHTRVGESDDAPGQEKRAPGESAPTPTPDPPSRAAAAATAPPPNAPTMAAPRPAGATPPPAASPVQPAPEAVAGNDGYRLDPLRPQALPSPGSSAQTRPAPPSPLQTLGLGGRAMANGINLNLNQQSVVSTVGVDQLTRERIADGERRKSEHRGSWTASGFERWRPAIENYVASVKFGNQTALNTARVPFATYLNTMHNRIHPIFADDFLSTLDGLPPGHPMNDPKMFAQLEIVLNRDDGHVVKMGVVKTSGVTAFDIAALDSVQRASPFGKPPAAIISGDGSVYLHWEFHRDPLYACSTAGARPFMLSAPPGAPTPPAKHPSPVFPPRDPRERAEPADSRQGYLGPLEPASRDLPP